MKKLVMLSVAAAFAMQGGLALAAGTPDTGPGCGLGKVVWQNYPNAKTKGAQILMATTMVHSGLRHSGCLRGLWGARMMAGCGPNKRSRCSRN